MEPTYFRWGSYGNEVVECGMDKATHVVLPRAEFDALVKERDEAVARMNDAWRSTSYADVQAMMRERDAATTRATEAEARANTATVAANLARDRADKAERERDELREILSAEREQARGARVVASLAAHARADKAEALLRELAQQYRYEFSDDEVARIDALLRGTGAP